MQRTVRAVAPMGLRAGRNRVDRVVAAVAAVVALLASALVAQRADAREPTVTIARTSHGIPHITASSWKGLGHGYGYAFAEDNICVIADTYVTVRAQRSRFFGPGGEYEQRGNGTSPNNLNSDFFWRRIADERIVERQLRQDPPLGPLPGIRRVVAGYVEGYNRYLRETGVRRLPDPNCRGADWVRPIRKIDVWRRFYQLLLLASQGVAIDGIGSAQPPIPGLDGAEASGPAAPSPEQLEELGERFDELAVGSNMYGLGEAATRGRGGMLLGNPHFPWHGPERFYQAHLRIPGKVNVSGASLFGVPAILIGHTRNFAWSHTVATAFRFTPFELTLGPGSPTSYLVDGEPREMERDQVKVMVRTAEGSLEPRRRTLYSTVYGPVFTELVGIPFPWTPLKVFAMGDANAEGLGRVVNHFLLTDRAQSVRRYHRIQRRFQGIPWVNSIAADSSGKAYYTMIGNVPNVTDEHASRCNSALGQVAFELLGLPVLDGSSSDCEWENDPDAPAPGLFGDRNLPSLFRNDYVTNSNDSHWLTNPERPLEGFDRIIGDERTARSLRTRLGLIMAQERLAGKDGMRGRGFTLGQLQRVVFNNRQYAGELFRDELVEMCERSPLLLSSSGPAEAGEACEALAGWNLRDDLDSRGALLFRRFATRLLASVGGLAPPDVYDEPFDPDDPVNTPRGLNTGSPRVQLALGDAINDLRNSDIPLDAPLRRYQFEPRGEDRIPIHGGPGGLGVFNAISGPWVEGEGYAGITTGSSFVMAARLTGDRCPKVRTILTYSLSTNPRSPYFADQTRMFSRKRWVRDRFCARQIRRDPNLDVTTLRLER